MHTWMNEDSDMHEKTVFMHLVGSHMMRNQSSLCNFPVKTMAQGMDVIGRLALTIRTASSALELLP